MQHIPEEGLSIIMGDLNNDDGLTKIGTIAGWYNSEAGRRIDYILSSKPVDVLQSSVRFNGKETPVVSDHAGVAVTVDL